MNELVSLVGIDVGSSSVSVVVAVEDEEGRLTVQGCGQAAHDGARKGVISDLEQVATAVRRAAEEAEAMSSLPVETAVVGIGGTPILGMRSTASVPITGRAHTVTEEDRRRALEACGRVAIPDDYRVLDILASGFAVDGQAGLQMPVGMPGSRLDAFAYVLYTHTTHAETVVKAVNQAGVEASSLVYEPVAAAEAVLTRDERDLGCLLLDVGYGSSEWMLFADGAAVASGATPVAGRVFTSDVAVMAKTTTEAAERVKREVGAAEIRPGAEGGGVEVPALGDEGFHLVERAWIAQILRDRARDLFVRVHRTLVDEGLEKAPRAGVVLTGGGSRLAGVEEIAQEIFGLRVRTGAPRALAGLTEPVSGPEWSVAWGLVLQEHRRRREGTIMGPENQRGIVGWLKRALGEFFEMGGGS